MSKFWLAACVSVFICLFVLWPHNSYAADIGIILSKTCITMLKNNASTNCPTYEEINLLFPDTSNQQVSGAFNYSDGFYERQPTKFKNHYEYYRYVDEPVTWIDPPGDIIEKIPRIIIQARDFEYTIKDQVVNSTSIKVGHSRYVSSTCTYSIITGANWLFLLGDTLKYLKSDCDPNETNFDEIKIKSWEAEHHDITTSAKYKLEQWIKASIERCGKTVCKNEEERVNIYG